MSASAQDQALNPLEHIQELERKLTHYRRRIHQVAAEKDKEIGTLLRELADYKLTESIALEFLDREGRGTMLSGCDKEVVRLCMKEIARRRGHVISGRLKYGTWQSVNLGDEDPSALKEALGELKTELFKAMHDKKNIIEKWKTAASEAARFEEEVSQLKEELESKTKKSWSLWGKKNKDTDG